MRSIASLLLPLIFSTASLHAGVPRGEKALFILSDGEEIFGTLVLETRTHLFIKVEDRIRQVKASAVERTLLAAQIPREYQRRRKALASTAEAHYRLAVWCRKVERYEDATALATAALKLDPKHAGASKELELLRRKDLTRVPWKENEAVALKIEVKSGAGKKWVDDKNSWSQLKLCLAGAQPPFTILPPDDVKIAPSYVLRVELEAEKVGEHRFFGEVIVSLTWRGGASLFVLDPAGSKRLFVMKPVTVEEQLPPSERAAEAQMCERAFQALLTEIRKHPGFRMKGRDKP